MIIPDGFAQINAIHTGDAAPTGAQWTLAVGLDSFSGGPADLAQTFETWILDSTLYSNVSSLVVMTAVLVKYGPNATGPSHLEPANEPGTGGTGSAPNVSFLTHKTTSLGGRAGRGRAFIPGVPEGDVNSNGLLTSGTATAVSLALASIIASANSDGCIPVVLHNEGSPITLPTAITSWDCDAKAATQRRRLRR